MTVPLRQAIAVLLAGLARLGAADAAPVEPPRPPKPTDSALIGAAIDRGCCVMLGADDPARLTALTNQGWILVHGLATDAATVARLRGALAEAGRYGIASVDLVPDYRSLPHQTNAVDLLVADLDALAGAAPPRAEIDRVLIPGRGVAWLRSGGSWGATRKPMPADMDGWSHGNHDATNNPVSRDAHVRGLRGVQWVANVEGAGIPSQLILAGGRWIGTRRIDYTLLMEKDAEFLEGRDAFNGMPLWLRQNDRTARLPRDPKEHSIVADERLVYGYFDQDGVSRALDAATGAEIARYPEAGVRNPNWDRKLPAAPFTHALADGVLVQINRATLTAYDTATHRLLWKHEEKGKAAIAHGLAIKDGRVFVAYADEGRPFFGYGHAHIAVQQLACFALRTGEERWRTDDYARIRTANLVAWEDALVIEDFRVIRGKGNAFLQAVVVIDAATGVERQRYDYPKPTQAGGLHGTFAIVDGVFDPMAGPSVPRIDLRSGAALPPSGASRLGWCGFTRWTPNIILPHASGWVDRRTGTLTNINIARSPCDVGVYPAYGLVYSTSAPCACRTLIRGLVAQSTGAADWTPAADDRRLVRGAGRPGAVPPQWPAPGSWPIFLGTVQRNPATATAVPAALAILHRSDVPAPRPASRIGVDWDENQDVLGQVSPPTVAEGAIVVAVPDAHRVDAYDAGDYRKRWSYTAGGRVDGPPTIYAGMAIFGSNDGRVQAVSLADGQLVWSYLAAPADRRIIASAQWESLWPVRASVPIIQGRVLAIAGRVNEADGGMAIVSLDPLDGSVKARDRIGIEDHAGGKPNPSGNRGTVGNDLITSDGTFAYLPGGSSARPPCYQIDPISAGWFHGAAPPAWARPVAGDKPMYAPKRGLFRRTLGGAIEVKRGDGIVFGGDERLRAHRMVRRGDEVFTCPWVDGPLRRHVLGPDQKLTMENFDESVTVGSAIELKMKPLAQSQPLQVGLVTAMALAGDHLVVVAQARQPAVTAGRSAEGCVLRLYGFDLVQQAEIALPKAGIIHGLAIADGRIFLTLVDGSIVVLGAR